MVRTDNLQRVHGMRLDGEGTRLHFIKEGDLLCLRCCMIQIKLFYNWPGGY